MQTLFLLTLVLAGWRLASLDEPVGAPAPQTPVVAAAAMEPSPPAATIPYRLVDGVDYVKPKPKVRGVPAHPKVQPATPPTQYRVPQAAPCRAPAPVYVYVYLVPVQARTTYDFAVEDAYYNPVFKGADQWHYDPWPEYLLYGRFYPAYISFPYPNPPPGRYSYRYNAPYRMPY